MSRKEIKQIAKANFKDHWGVLLLVVALWNVALGWAGILGLGLGSFIVSGPLIVGVLYVYLNVIKNGNADWKDMFFGFRKIFPKSFIVEALRSLIIGIPAACAGFVAGSLLMHSIHRAFIRFDAKDMMLESGGSGAGTQVLSVIEGLLSIAAVVLVIILFLTYAEALFILLKEPEIKPLDALKKSRLMMKGNKGRLFIFELSFIGWGILCLLTLGLLCIYVAPYYYYAKTMLLEQIYQERCGVSMDDDAEMQKLLALKDNVKAKTDSVTEKAREKTEGHNPKRDSKKDTLNRDTLNIESNAEEPNENVCKFCGAPLPEGASFCGKCGKQQ